MARQDDNSTHFVCPGCRRSIKTSRDMLGKRETCPYCGSIAVVGEPLPPKPPGAALPGAAGSLICGIIGLFPPTIVLPACAIALSRRARRLARLDADLYPDVATGLAMAMAGGLLGILGLVKDIALVMLLISIQRM